MRFSLNRTYLLLFLLLPMLLFAQDRKILIIAESDSLPDNADVYIVGGRSDLGYWTRHQKMKREGENKWVYELSAKSGDTLFFKFTRGDWSTEAVDSNGMEFPNFSHFVNNDTTLKFRFTKWRDQVQQKIILTKERILNKGGFVELFEGWKYKIGDDTAWADPDYDDSDWKNINPQLSKEDFDKLDWTGNIWFRNEIQVDSSLWNIVFGFNFYCTGAAEVYLNGRLLYKYGVVGTSKQNEEIFLDRNPRHILFDKKETQVLAVRYSNHSAEKLANRNIEVGFTAMLGDMEVFSYNRINAVRELTVSQMAFGAFILAFAIMHLLLFVFYPKVKENLFYSISMLSFAAVIYTSVQNNFNNSILSSIILLTINSVAVQLSLLFGLLTVYTSSYGRMPKYYIFFIIATALFVIHTIFFPLWIVEAADIAFFIFAGIITAEIVRSVIRSIKNKQEWSWGWLIGVGFIVAILLIGYQVLILTDVITQPLFGIYLVYVYGLVFLAITVSINLAKRMADTHLNLEKQLVQVKDLSQKTIEQERRAKEEEFARKLLEADNQRKTKELEEARKLQLSMLPNNVPEVPGFEIAVYMKTASEVGGDYYDFKYDNNGRLIVAVGDATGHGMKAGTMVATIKGLFTAENSQTDVVTFLNKSNSIIRDMRLGNIYMAMLVAKIENEKVTISSAGMPPALIHRIKNNQVEEVKLQAIPLGGPADFTYPKKETTLSSGDTLLLMSDGFPELFNEKKEILDYHIAREIFASIEHSSADNVIKHLLAEVERWKGNAKQEDDITFVVIRKN
ncbi:MAG: SpoIIE family protein phosphatase [bacterium]|nr:SpoIIE family protein phosphatase [bacterium]